jgi:uncharacterized oligopeptide transporter (OPT) family protein
LDFSLLYLSKTLVLLLPCGFLCIAVVSIVSCDIYSTVCTGFFGIFFVIPLRRYYIVHQKLTFPTPAATAYTIRSLHRGKEGAEIAKKKSLALLYSFVACFVFKVVSSYAPGIVSAPTSTDHVG